MSLNYNVTIDVEADVRWQLVLSTNSVKIKCLSCNSMEPEQFFDISAMIKRMISHMMAQHQEQMWMVDDEFSYND